MTVDGELSRAVAVYVTTRPHGFPHQDPEALAEAFGPEAEDLKRRIDGLIGEMFTAPPPWLGRSEPMQLDELFRVVGASVGERHPELSPEAVTALANYYTYCNR